jgi:lipopolysaccharide export system protein LptA
LQDSFLQRQQERYTRRRNRLRRLLALVLAATAAAVGLAFWAALHRKNTLNNVRANLPQNVARRLSGETYTRSEQGREIFTIHAARTLAYNQGSSTLLEDVHVVIFGRTGNQHDEIQADRCRYDTETGAMACYGKASITLETSPSKTLAQAAPSRPPVVLHTSKVFYDSRHALVKTDQPVRFQYGPSSGTGVGLAYNTQKSRLDLKREVALELEPRPSTKVPVRVTAGGLLYAKQSGQITLRPPVRFSQADRTLTSATGVLYLNAQGQPARAVLAGGVQGFAKLPNGNFQGSAERVHAFINPQTSQLQTLDAAGSVHLAVENARQGTIRRLSAQHVVVNFSSPKERPKSATAAGDVQLADQPTAPVARFSSKRGAGNPAQEGERILASEGLGFRFSAGGVVESAATAGPGEIRLIPQNGSATRQTVTAGRFLMAFDRQGRLKSIRGVSGSRIVSQPGPEAPPGSIGQTSTADKLDATLDPSAGTITTARQTGNFEFWQGDRRASADAGSYSARSQRLTLTGHPLIWDADSRIQARHIAIDLSDGVARGWGGVQSIHFDAGPSATRKGSKAPSGNETISTPLIVLADQVIARKQSQFVRYAGNVRAWHGPDMIQSSSLDVYKRQERVSSGFGVLTSLVQAGFAASNSIPKSRQAPKRAVQPLTIHADHLVYFSLGNEAVYRGHVEADSENTILRAERLEAYFSKPHNGGEPAVKRVVADGNVTALQLPGRRASGQHAEYFPGSGKVVLTGGPPVIYDAKQGYLTAQRLTFFTHDASLIADGGRKTPTLSRYRVSQQ